MCGGLPPKSVRAMKLSFSMSRSRATRVRLLIGSRLFSSSIVRFGPDTNSRTTSIVHLSPSICSAPVIGQPSSSRRFMNLRSQVDVVCLDFRVERGGVHAQQACGPRLMPAGLFERAPDQIDLETAHLFVEINAAADVADGRIARAVLVAGGNGFRVADLRAQALLRDLVARRDHHRALDRVLQLADVAGPRV